MALVSAALHGFIKGSVGQDGMPWPLGEGGRGEEEEEDAQTCNPLPSRTHACTQSETGISLWMGILKSEADFLIRHHHHRHLRCGSLMPEVRRLGPYE